MTETPVVTPAGRRQRGTLCRLEAQCFGWERVFFGVWRRGGEPGVSAWTAQLGGKTAGFLIAYRLDIDGMTGPYIAALGVASAHRRRGVARALLCEILTMHGAAWLHVRTSNASAIALYDSMRFTVVRRIGAYYHDGEDAYVMRTGSADTQPFHGFR